MTKLLAMAATVVLSYVGFQAGTAQGCEVAPTVLYRVIAWDETRDLVVLRANRSHGGCEPDNVEAYLVRRLSSYAPVGVLRTMCYWKGGYRVEIHSPGDGEPSIELKAPSNEWGVVAAKTKWANLPLERQHMPDPSGRIALVESSEKSAYLAVRTGDAVTRLLWLPEAPPPREKGSLARTAQVWKATDGIVVIVTITWSEGWHRPRREAFAYHFTDDDLAHPRSAALQARFLLLAEQTRLSNGLYRSAADIGPLPPAVLPRAICSLAKTSHQNLARSWFRRQVRQLASAERQLFFEALRPRCPPAFLHRVRLGPKAKDESPASAPCGP
jgi:hypothetical protein